MDKLIQVFKSIAPLQDKSHHKSTHTGLAEDLLQSSEDKNGRSAEPQNRFTLNEGGRRRPLRSLSVERDRKKREKHNLKEENHLSSRETLTHRSQLSELMENISVLEEHFEQFQCRRSLFTQRTENNMPQNKRNLCLLNKYAPKSRINLLVTGQGKCLNQTTLHPNSMIQSSRFVPVRQKSGRLSLTSQVADKVPRPHKSRVYIIQGKGLKS